jgi:uncharacterized protein YbjQ (UPF0145 family)
MIISTTNTFMGRAISGYKGIDFDNNSAGSSGSVPMVSASGTAGAAA